MSGVAEYVPPSAIDHQQSISCHNRVYSVPSSKTQIKTTRKVPIPDRQGHTQCRSHVAFSCLGPAHSCTGMHTQLLPKHQTYNRSKFQIIFSVLRTDLGSNDGFFRWVRWPRWSPSDFDISPIQLWSGMSVNVVNGNYRVTRKIEENRQDRIEHNLHNSVYR